MQDVPTPLTTINYSAYGISINVLGHVTGRANNQAYIFNGNTVTNIGDLLGLHKSSGHEINNNGTIVGSATPNSFSVDQAFAYDGININWLDGLGGDSSSAQSINNSEQITGWAFTNSGYRHAFLYTNGAMLDLGTLGGNSSEGNDINELGQITGRSRFSSALTPHAFLYNGDQMQDLGTLGGSISIGYAINDLTQIVGYAATSDQPRSTAAFIYEEGQMHNLNDLIDSSDPLAGKVKLTVARGINNLGQITGEMTGLGPNHSAFLLTPITSPSEFSGINGLEGDVRIQTGIDGNEQAYLGPRGTLFSGIKAGLRIGFSNAEAPISWTLASLSDNGDYQIINADTPNQTLCMSSISWSVQPILINCNASDLRQSWHISAFEDQFIFQNNDTKQCLGKTLNFQQNPHFEFIDCSNTSTRAFGLEFQAPTSDDTPSPLEGAHTLTPSNSNSLLIGWTETRAGAAAKLVDSSTNLQWSITADGEAGYIIQANDTAQARCLALPSWSNDLPILNRCDNGNRQHWDISGNDDSGYSLTNAETGRCLSRVAGSDNLLRLRDCDRSTLQVFNVE